MTRITITPMPTETARAYRSGTPDANGQAPERAISPGPGYPCRHCLEYIPEGKPYLILAYRPFDSLQPYAELGPIFLCADDCAPWQGDGLPPVLAQSPEDRLLKGYSPGDRIVYGLGRIVPPDSISDQAAEILGDRRVAYVHARSATNNCFTCRIDRARYSELRSS